MSAPLDWDGWREVTEKEAQRALEAEKPRRTLSEHRNNRVSFRYFLPVPPVPDDAIGMCPNGHVMVRSSGDVDGWRHHQATFAAPDVHLPESCKLPDRTVEVIGTRSKP